MSNCKHLNDDNFVKEPWLQKSKYYPLPKQGSRPYRAVPGKTD